jgi:hypothetical protein
VLRKAGFTAVHARKIPIIRWEVYPVQEFRDHKMGENTQAFPLESVEPCLFILDKTRALFHVTVENPKVKDNFRDYS